MSKLLLETCYPQLEPFDCSHFPYCILFLSSTPQHISFAIKSTFKLGVKVNHRGYISPQKTHFPYTHPCSHAIPFDPKTSTVLLLVIGAMDLLNNIQVKTLR
jgi:hypothetical protein